MKVLSVLCGLKATLGRQKRLAESDICFFSYPKSGATWVNYMLCNFLREHHLLHDEGKTVQISDLSRRYFFIPTITWSHEDSFIVSEKGASPENVMSVFENCFPKHLPERLIFMVRDPRDVAVSYFHQATNRSLNPVGIKSVDDFVRHDVFGIKRVIAYYERWFRAHQMVSAFHLIKYEEMLSDPEVHFRRLIEFLGYQSYREEAVSAALEKSSVTAMRASEVNGEVSGMRAFEKSNSNSLKVRKAKVGSFQEELSEETIEYCNSLLRCSKELFGYEREI